MIFKNFNTMDNCNKFLNCQFVSSEFYIHCSECDEYTHFDNLHEITNIKMCYTCTNEEIEYIRYCHHCNSKTKLNHCRQCYIKKILSNTGICNNCNIKNKNITKIELQFGNIKL